MPIPVACQCGAKFAAKDELAGKAVKCPKCGQPLKIPAAGGAPASEAPSAAAKKPAGAASPTKTATPKPQTPKPTPAPVSAVADIFDEIGIAGSKTGIRCPNCNADMQPGAVICITCGYNTQTKKKIETVSDSKTIAKREEVYAKQRAAAEAKFKASGGKSGSSGGAYDDRRSGLAWIRDGGSLGSVFESAKQIAFNPTYVFATLPPTGGTLLAIGFPAMAWVFVVGIYAIIYFCFLMLGLMSIMGRPDVDMTAVGAFLLAVVIGVVVNAAAGALLNLIFAPISGLCVSVIAHPIVKYWGGSELTFGATFRCIMYVTGATMVIASVPCVGWLFAIVHIFFMFAFALIHHHRVSGVIGALASIAGILGGLVLNVILGIYVYVPVAIGLAYLLQQYLNKGVP
jgi:hypothetical protein